MGETGAAAGLGGEDSVATGSLRFGATGGGAGLSGGPLVVVIGTTGATAGLDLMSTALVASMGGRTPVCDCTKQMIFMGF